jgi:PAS domain S-box-containing protein
MDRLTGAGPVTAAQGMAFQILASPDGASRRFAYVSRSCEALNGIPAEAAMADASALYDLVMPEYRPVMISAEAAALATLSPFSVEVPFRRPDGLIRWFRISSTPHRLEDGSIAWEGIQLDITEERVVQRRLALALEATGLGLWEYQVETGELYWSRRTRELYGLGPDDEVNFEVFKTRVHPDDRDVSLKALNDAMTPQGGDFVYEHRVARPDGAIVWVLAHGRVLAEGGKPWLVVGTSLDITARKQQEEAKALLLGELNHRVKNDFQIVSGLLELQARRSDDPAVRAELEKAQRRVAGIAHAHQNLYADDGRAVVDMDVYLGDICARLSEGMFQDREVAMTWRIEPARLTRERAVAVGLIVNELVTNAVKHAFPDGRSGRVEVVLERSGEKLSLTIADDGPGLPANHGESKGLGHNLIQAFAKQAGGRLELGQGPGTRFILQMPA